MARKGQDLPKLAKAAQVEIKEKEAKEATTGKSAKPETETKPEEPSPNSQASVPDKPKAPKAKKRAAVKKPPVRDGYIYILTSPEMKAAGKYKLGFHTGDREKLISRYITSLHLVEIILFIEGKYEEEQAIHAKLSEARLANARGNDSEWYEMPIRTLISRALEILTTLSTPDGPEEPAPLYLGPSKFYEAGTAGRWNLIDEWLASREYRQDKHRKSKVRKSDAESLQWNAAHRWYECFLTLCRSGGSGEFLAFLDRYIRYCEGRWVSEGKWLTPQEALKAGYREAKEAGTPQAGEVAAYLEKNWQTGAAESPEPTPPSSCQEIDSISLAPRPRSHSSPREPDLTRIPPLSRPVLMSLLADPRPALEARWSLKSSEDLLYALLTSLENEQEEEAVEQACDILEADHRVLLAYREKIPNVFLARVAVVAARKRRENVLKALGNLGLSSQQCARAAAAQGDLEALEYIVMHLGANWTGCTREAVLHLYNSGSDHVIKYLEAQGVTLWDAAMVTAAELGLKDLVGKFAPLSSPSRLREALRRAIINNQQACVELLAERAGVMSEDVKLATTQEMTRYLLSKVPNEELLKVIDRSEKPAERSSERAERSIETGFFRARYT